MASVSEEAVDWRVGLNVLERFTYMFDGMYASDVKFLVGEGDKQETIHCHSFPLIAGSSVFEHMLKNKRSETITVSDLEASGFKALIRYLYNGELDVKASNVISLMYASRKYVISDVTEKCLDFLKNTIQSENVCKILEASIHYNEEAVTEKCLHFISGNSTEVLSSADFTDLPQEALVKIIGNDDLKVGSEMKVYKACLRWSHAECSRRQKEITDANRREVLGEALYRIRFPTMTHTEFAKVSTQSELLTAIERVKIYDHIIAHGSSDRTPCCKLEFNTESRLSFKEVTIKRFSPESINHVWGTMTTHNVVNALDFQSNRSVVLAGISLFGGNTPFKYHVSMKVLKSSGEVVTSVDDLPVNTDGSKSPVKVEFPKPAEVTGDTRYSLVVSVQGRNETYYGTSGEVNFTVEDFSVTLYDSSHGVFNARSHARTSTTERGPIAELHFKITE